MLFRSHHSTNKIQINPLHQAEKRVVSAIPWPRVVWRDKPVCSRKDRSFRSGTSSKESIEMSVFFCLFSLEKFVNGKRFAMICKILLIH